MASRRSPDRGGGFACRFGKHSAARRPHRNLRPRTNPKVGIANRGSLHLGRSSRPNHACDRWPRERRASVHHTHCAKSGHNDSSGACREWSLNKRINKMKFTYLLMVFILCALAWPIASSAQEQSNADAQLPLLPLDEAVALALQQNRLVKNSALEAQKYDFQVR